MGEHQFSDLMADRLHEECGVVGISSPSDDVAQMVFLVYLHCSIEVKRQQGLRCPMAYKRGSTKMMV